MRRSLTATLAVTALCALLSSALVLTPAVGAVQYAPAPYSELLKQIRAHQITRAVINKKAHTVKVTVADGRHENVVYPSHQARQLETSLKDAGSIVKLARHKAKAKAAGHRLRYIAGGIIAVLAVLGGTFFYIDHRRRGSGGGTESATATAEASTGAAPPPSPPSENP